jgi:hypothetical protein
MSTYHFSCLTILALNALWFGAGFQYFSFSSVAAAKLIVPKALRGSPVFPIVVASGRFLGGMNMAFCAFAVLLLVTQRLFPQAQQMAVFAAVFALAHGSQFAFNVPIALQARAQDQPLWVVLKGPMLMIFTIDAVLALANALLAVALILA